MNTMGECNFLMKKLLLITDMKDTPPSEVLGVCKALKANLDKIEMIYWEENLEEGKERIKRHNQWP